MDQQRDQPTNAQVIAAAGMMAAILAGLAIALGRRRDDERSVARQLPERAEHAVEEATGRARAAARRVAAVVPETATTAEERALAAARGGWGRLARLAAAERTAVAHAGEAAGVGAKRLPRDARRAAKRGGKRGHEVTVRAREQAQRLGEQSASTAQAIAAQAAAAAVAGAERALGLGATVADVAKERLPQVTHKVGEEVVPSLRDVALHAASTAVDLWQAARERATEAAHVDLAQPAANVAHVLAARGERARDATTAAAGKAAGKATELGGRAKDASRRTAETTVETSKDAGALLFWAGAAAGLVYYAVMSPERREQLTRAAQTAATQVQELIKDLQGYDDEF